MNKPVTTPIKQFFWRPILLGTITALALFTLFAYFAFINIITCLFIVPFSAGFITLATSNAVVKRDKICQIFLPWAALVMLLLFPAYWKLKVLIILVFPIASLGGLTLGKLFNKFNNN